MKTKWLNCISLETKSTELTQTMLISHYYSLTSYHNQQHFKLLIKALKYHNRRDIGIYLGTILGEKIKRTWTNNVWDILIPVPLHFTKKWERGYNQSHYIAKGIAEILGIPIVENAIVRKKRTSTQTKLNTEKRKENMKGAFLITKPEIIQNNRILLVDDVCTTGATILSLIEEMHPIKGVVIGVATICTA
ncbi:ComF family protein [Halosquirtibacter laminarini]|uniref:ComF family protein n=1 Tax=Halosquirtibacter laminarini TaxID=3374600 RepID=A0AC61NEM3_9BACT|nr:ComF family protein [Prolixibacteraceae bacterium]